MIKTSWIYILFYIKLALIANLVIYYTVAILYEIVNATYIFKPFVRYTFGLLQPVMVLPVTIFDLINLRPLQLIYFGIIVAIFAFEGVIILLWMIALAVRPLLFGKNFLENTIPFEELDRDGAFEWFFEKTGANVKSKEIINYILDLLKEIMSPEEFEMARQRCRETFIGGGNIITNKGGFTPIPPKEHIDYDYEKSYEADGRTEDRFYRGSYLSIRHREDANAYKNMTIARPDRPTIPDIPDITNKIKTEMSYFNIKLNSV
jgi:hypothetical protein